MKRYKSQVTKYIRFFKENTFIPFNIFQMNGEFLLYKKIKYVFRMKHRVGVIEAINYNPVEKSFTYTIDNGDSIENKDIEAIAK